MRFEDSWENNTHQDVEDAIKDKVEEIEGRIDDVGESVPDAETIEEIRKAAQDAQDAAAAVGDIINENSGRLSHNKAPAVVLRYIHQNGTDDMSLDDLNAGDVYADAGGSLELVVIENGSKTVKNIGTIDKGLIFYSIREEGFFRYLGSAAWELLSQGGEEEQEGTFAELDVDSRLKHIQSPVMVLDCISQSEKPGIADCPIGGYYCYMGNQASACRIRYRKAKVTAGQYEDIDLSSPQGHVLYYNKPEDKTYHWDGMKLVAVLWHAGLAIDNRLMSSRATAIVLWYISDNLVDGEIHMDPQSGDVYCDSNNHIIVKGGTVNPNKEYMIAANLPTTTDADLGLPDQKLVYYDVNKKDFYRWNGSEWKKALDIDIDTTNLVTITQLNNTLSSYATKNDLLGKQDKLTGSDVLATINSTQVHYGDSVNIEGQKGDKGEKGDTGDCELRQGDDVVSIIKNDFSGGTGYIASAELAKTLNDKSIGKGTYGQAWAHSQLSGQLFPWIWDEMVSGDAVLKPIWHIGNGRFIDAVGAEITIDGIAASTPTFSQGGGEVIGGTQVTIIPSAGALLYVTINGSSPTVSETAQKITINQASMVIDAWCATYGGASAHVTNTYTAEAPNEPTFNPSTDGAATRNMALTVIPASGCELHYKINDGSVQTSQGALSTTILAEDYIYKIEAWSYDASTQMQSAHVTKTYTIARPNAPTMPDSGTVERGASITIGRNNASGSIKYRVGSATTLTVEGDTATVQLTAQQSTIEAWVELNGETSEHVTRNYTMAALNPPVFSPSGGEVLEGGQVTISAAPGATIHYTTDGSTPTAISPSYAGPITINAAMTIKAYASDNYGNSAVAEAIYTVKEDALIIDTTDQTTEVTITYKTGGTLSNMTTASKTFQLNSDVHPVIDGVTDTTSYRNTIVYGKDFAQEVDGTNVDMDSDKLITSLTFTSKTTTKRVDTGGGALFEPYATFSDFSNMVYADVKVLNTKTTSGGNYNVGNLKYIFRRIGGSRDANNPVKLKIRGMANGVSGQLYVNNYTGSHYVDIDISELQPSDQENGCFNNFYNVCVSAYSTYTIGGNFSLRQGIGISSAMFNSDEAKTTKITIKSATPPDISANSDVTGGLNWLERIVSAHQDAGTTLTIRIPVGSKPTYQSSDSSVSKGWGTYANNSSIVWDDTLIL